MNFFKKIFEGSEEKENKEEVNENSNGEKEKEVKLGEVNRYENNPDLREEINEKAKNIVDKATKVLNLLSRNPEKANSHSEFSGKRWNIHYIQEDIRKELEDLYGTNLDNISKRLKGVPSEVASFYHKREEVLKMVSDYNEKNSD